MRYSNVGVTVDELALERERDLAAADTLLCAAARLLGRHEDCHDLQHRVLAIRDRTMERRGLMKARKRTKKEIKK